MKSGKERGDASRGFMAILFILGLFPRARALKGKAEQKREEGAETSGEAGQWARKRSKRRNEPAAG